MRLANLLCDVRIGVKLGVCVSLGAVLVAAMIVTEQLSSSYIEGLTAAADEQQTAAMDSIAIDAVFRGAQIVSRELRMVRAEAEVETALTELQQIAQDGHTRLAALRGRMVQFGDRNAVLRGDELFTEFVSALAEIGQWQKEILKLFADREQTEMKWARSANLVVNSASFANLPNSTEVEAFVNEATSAFKDARTAAWRYFVLNESYKLD